LQSCCGNKLSKHANELAKKLAWKRDTFASFCSKKTETSRKEERGSLAKIRKTQLVKGKCRGKTPSVCFVFARSKQLQNSHIASATQQQIAITKQRKKVHSPVCALCLFCAFTCLCVGKSREKGGKSLKSRFYFEEFS